MFARLAHLARAALLGTTLLAAATAWIFVARPHWVDAFDAEVVARHTQAAAATLARAQRQGATPAEVVAELEPLLGRLEDVRKGDRLDACKRGAFATLVAARLAAGSASQALLTAEAWRAFDPLDLGAKLAAHDAMAAQPGFAALAANLASELFTVAPDRPRFVAPHLRACLGRQDATAAAAAFFAHLRAGGTPASGNVVDGWTLWRDDGDGFDPARVETLDVTRIGDEVRVGFRPVFDTKRLRLALPPRAAFRLRAARFRIATDAHAVEVPVRALARQTGDVVGGEGIEYDGDDLMLIGHDAPTLLWSLGPGARIATTWTLLGTVEVTTPSWLAAILALPEVGGEGRVLLRGDAIEDAAARDRYLACRRAVLATSQISVQVGDSDPVAVVLTAQPDDSVAFAATLNRGDATRVRVTMPAVAALDVALRAPQTFGARMVPGPGLRVDGDVVTVEAPATALEFALRPGDPATLTIAGSLR